MSHSIWFVALCVREFIWLACGDPKSDRPHDIQYLELQLERPVQIRALEDITEVWDGMEAMGHAWKPSKGLTRDLHVVRSLLLPQEIQALRIIADRNSSHVDSVDGKQAYETYFASEPSNEVPPDIRAAMNNRILPYVRETYSCPTCVICTALSRRYRPDERRAHPHHCDNEAYVTAIAALNDPDDFSGGLYVQTSEQFDSRKYIDLGMGDVLFHQYDLKHGVNVEHGSRYSAIFWVKDSDSSCRSNTTPWYDHDAAAGDADAQYSLGYQYQVGKYGSFAINYTAAMEWYARAAEQGHGDAQTNLAWMHQEGLGAKRSDADAIYWLEKAVQEGHPQALENLARLYADGIAGPHKQEEAVGLRLRAAKQGFLDAQVNLASMLLQGNGVESNEELGAHWMLAAAAQGDSVAQFNLGQLYVYGIGVPQDQMLAVSWFQKAAVGGNSDAKTQLAALKANLEL